MNGVEGIPPKRMRDQVGSRARGAQRRIAILKAGKALLMEKGYGDLIMRDVAQHVGIRIGNLHYYFPTKQDLFLAIFDQETFEYAERLRTAVASVSSKVAKLSALIETSIDVIKGPEVIMWRMLVALAQHSPEYSALLKRESSSYHDAAAAELVRIQPELTAHRAKHIAQLLWAMIDGLALQNYEDHASVDARALEIEARSVLRWMVELT